MGSADNITYLVFDKNGEMMENKQHEDTIFKCGYNDEFQIRVGSHGVDALKISDGFKVDSNITVLDGHANFCEYSIRVKVIDIASHDCRLITVNHPNGFRCSAIIYHKQLDSIGFHWFYEFAKFFLPEREPRCCCKENYNKVLLPYVNKIMQSMVKHFKVGYAYENDEWTKDMVCTRKTKKEEIDPFDAGESA